MSKKIKKLSDIKNDAPKMRPLKKQFNQPSISIEASDRETTPIDVPIEQQEEPKKKTLDKKVLTQTISLANILVLTVMFAFGFIYLVFFKHETIANDENRYLAKFPKFSKDSYLSGEYTEGIANYFDDTVHSRAKIKEFIADTIMPLKGRKYGSGEDEVELFGVAFEHSEETTAATTTVTTVTTKAASTSSGETTTTTVTTKPVTTTTVPTADNPAADGEINNNILIANKRGMSIYGGGWGAELEYADYLNAYKSSDERVNVYSMVIPTAISYYLPENYKDLTYSEKDDIDKINEALIDVEPVDVYQTLLMHKNEPIYSRTDHHWQPLGAYYAAEEFAKVADVTFADISEYEKVTLPNFMGSFYSFTNSATLLNNPEDFTYYIPNVNVSVTQYSTSFRDPVPTSLIYDPTNFSTSSYYMVFGMDNRIVHVNNPDADNERTLVIFKDSYGNALLPMLAGSFENIYLCDIRYFDLNAIEFLEEVEATDLLFAMCSFSAVGANHTEILRNLSR